MDGTLSQILTRLYALEIENQRYQKQLKHYHEMVERISENGTPTNEKKERPVADQPVGPAKEER